ncbi:hypothetical protein ADUPG1_011251, partial [Aduncisulcus paluster]
SVFVVCICGDSTLKVVRVRHTSLIPIASQPHKHTTTVCQGLTQCPGNKYVESRLFYEVKKAQSSPPVNVTALACDSTNGDWVFTADSGGTVKIWSTKKLKALCHEVEGSKKGAEMLKQSTKTGASDASSQFDTAKGMASASAALSAKTSFLRHRKAREKNSGTTDESDMESGAKEWSDDVLQTRWNDAIITAMKKEAADEFERQKAEEEKQKTLRAKQKKRLKKQPSTKPKSRANRLQQAISRHRIGSTTSFPPKERIRHDMIGSNGISSHTSLHSTMSGAHIPATLEHQDSTHSVSASGTVSNQTTGRPGRSVRSDPHHYDILTEKVSFFAHVGGVTSLDYSSSHKWIVTGGADGVVRVWNLDGCLMFECDDTFPTASETSPSQRPATNNFTARKISFFAHVGGVTSLDYSSSHKWIVTGGADGVVRVWNLDGCLMFECDDTFPTASETSPSQRPATNNFTARKSVSRATDIQLNFTTPRSRSGKKMVEMRAKTSGGPKSDLFGTKPSTPTIMQSPSIATIAAASPQARRQSITQGRREVGLGNSLIDDGTIVPTITKEDESAIDKAPKFSSSSSSTKTSFLSVSAITPTSLYQPLVPEPFKVIPLMLLSSLPSLQIEKEDKVEEDLTPPPRIDIHDLVEQGIFFSDINPIDVEADGQCVGDIAAEIVGEPRKPRRKIDMFGRTFFEETKPSIHQRENGRLASMAAMASQVAAAATIAASAASTDSISEAHARSIAVNLSLAPSNSLRTQSPVVIDSLPIEKRELVKSAPRFGSISRLTTHEQTHHFGVKINGMLLKHHKKSDEK